MQRLIPVLALWALCSAAPAQSLYKCRVGGTTTYSGSPCPGTPSTPVAVPDAPPRDPEFAKELKRQQTESAKLEKERLARQKDQERVELAAGKAAQTKRERCDKLALERKWADEAADEAAGPAKDELLQKAQRMRESMAVECPG
jgi:hypothetical protein